MYDFSREIDRRNTSSLKWDVQDHELPMWVADMDFETCPDIIEALHKRVDHGVFGYNIVPSEYYCSIQSWWKKYHHFEMEIEWMMFCTGVVPAISSIVRKMTTVGENILIQSPVYNIFYNSILNNGRHIISSHLIYDGKEYQIDFEDLEAKLALPQTTMMILCNPHNPIGKIWDKETLKRIGELCYKYHVLVISDEIHCDITAPGKEYVPFASVSKVNQEISMTCIAPTKAFNLAGLQTACIVVPNENLRHKVNRGINTDEVAEPNSFAVIATVAAFQKGREWLEELRKYIQKNKHEAMTYIQKYIPELYVVPSEATYLLWVDCSKICQNSVELVEFIRNETGLYVSDGLEYGENGKQFIRINIACPLSRVYDGLNRLRLGIEKFIKKNAKLSKVHEFEEMKVIELKYHENTENILNHYYLQKQNILSQDFIFNQMEMMTIETLLNLIGEDID